MTSTIENHLSLHQKENLMRNLLWKALVLTLLVACFIVIPSPQRTRADIWGECDAARSARNDYCLQQYNTCILNSGSNCQQNYNDCLDEAARLHHDYTQSPPTGCLFENPEDPVPWPVIDHSRSDCLATCSQGASQIENFLDRWDYYDACWNYCDANFPKP
jgi:hypothetical protein